MEKNEILKRVSVIENLPSLPLVVNQVLELVADQNSTTSDAAQLILSDQALTAKILKIVNSAFYGYPKKITTVSQAVVILGFDTIKNLLLSISVLDVYRKESKKSKDSFDLKKHIGHSLGVAVAGEMIARSVKYPEPEEIFVAGLLHDMGKIILCLYFPDEFSRVLEQAKQEKLFFHQAEKEVLGTDHSAVGKLIAEKWNLPPLLTDSIFHHHHHVTQIKMLKEPSALVTAIIKIANGMVKHEEIGFSGDYRLPSPEKELMEFIGLSDADYDNLLPNLKENLKKAAEVMNIKAAEMTDYFASIQQANLELGKINLDIEQANTMLTMRNAELDALHRICSEGQKMSHDKLLQFICEHIHSVFHFDRVMMGRYVPHKKLLKFSVLLGEESPLPFNWQVEPNSLISQVLTDKQSLRIQNANDKKYEKEGFLQEIQAHACVIFPIYTQDTNAGIIVCDFKDSRREISEEQFKSIETFVNQMSQAIEKHELFHSLASVNEKLDQANRELQTKIGRLTTLKSYNQSIIESMTNGFISVNAELKIIVSNHANEDILGFKSAELMGKNILEVPNLKDLAKILRLTISEEKSQLRNEIEFSRPNDKKEIILGVSTAPVREKGNEEVVGAIAIFRDLTERKLAQERQKELEEQLHQAQKMEAVGTLAGGVAHDFNNLLTGILGYTNLMLIKTTPEHPFHEKLTVVEDLAMSGAELIKQLLGFARGGKYEVREISLNELIQRTISMFARTRKELVVHTNFQDDIWLIEADAGQIEQVILNLYVNAWQAMPGGGDLFVETENVVLDSGYVQTLDIFPGRYVKFSVTDTGIGMDNHTKQRVFEPFFTTKEMGRGTGLGLASAYGIIRNHGGLINIYSELHKGSTFKVYLPVSSQLAQDERRVTDGDLLEGTETILLVDDEDIILRVCSETLETLGYNVIKAKGGRKAVEIYKEKKDDIDLILLDMIMPELNGEEAFWLLKEISPNVKVLLASGFSINNQVRMLLESGCKGFLQKPFIIKELSRKIREVLAQM